MYELVERSNNIIKKLLQIISYGDDLISKEIEITDANRKMIYDLLMPIYTNMVKDKKEKQQIGIDIAKANNKYKGRQKKQIDVLSFSQIKEDYLKHNITADKASKIIGISRSTFLRRVKDLIK